MQNCRFGGKNLHFVNKRLLAEKEDFDTKKPPKTPKNAHKTLLNAKFDQFRGLMRFWRFWRFRPFVAFVTISIFLAILEVEGRLEDLVTEEVI